MTKSKLAEEVYFTKEEYLAKFPTKAVHLKGSILERFVSWVCVETNGKGRAESYFLISSRAYTNACNVLVTKADGGAQLSDSIERERVSRRKISELQKQNSDLKKQVEALDPIKNAMDALLEDRRAAKKLIEQLESLVNTLRQRAGA